MAGVSKIHLRLPGFLVHHSEIALTSSGCDCRSFTLYFTYKENEP
jgi:hypothetical protein